MITSAVPTTLARPLLASSSTRVHTGLSFDNSSSSGHCGNERMSVSTDVIPISAKAVCACVFASVYVCVCVLLLAITHFSPQPPEQGRVPNER